MGKPQSKNNKNLNNSFPGLYVLEENDEILLDDSKDNKINFGKKTENLGNGIIKTTEISNGIIRMQTYRRKTDSEIYNEELKKRELERKEREELERKKR